jgi:phosphatidylglycerol---prolipoprotein diacylglyceryl transferase
VGRFRLFYVHSHLFQFGRLVLPIYGFLVALGTVLSLLVCLRTGRLLSLDTDKIWTVAVLAVVAALLGSWALSILLHWPRNGFAIGFAFVAIAVATAVLSALWFRLPIRRTADAFAPSLALYSSVVSIACFEAGCDYGTPTNLPWAVVFNRQATMPNTPLGVPLHPTQLYAGLIQFVLFAFLMWWLHRPHGDGEVLGAWLFLAGLSSFFLTFLRGDNGPLLSALVPVRQLVSAGMVLGGGLLWLRGPYVPQVSNGG